MTGFVNKFKIPTLLGLGIIFLGIISGLYLTLREQVYLSQAAPNLTPKNITLANVAEDSVVVSWQTNSKTASFITFGQNNSGQQSVLDDRDSNKPKPRSIHYVTLKNLLPKTSYQFKIHSGKITSEVQKFETAPPLTNQSEFRPIIGSVLSGDTPLGEGVVFLSIADAITQSALVKEGGSFLIPLSNIRKADLSDFQPTEGAIAKLTVRSDLEDASILFKLEANSTPLPPVKLGQSIDLTSAEETPLPSPDVKDLDQYDLNSDGKINAADNAIILQNFGPLRREASKKPKDKKGDLNADGVVNQKDLDLMAKKLEELGSQ